MLRGITDGERTLSVVTEYLYDENGSMVKEKEEDKTASYRYDLLNRQTYVKMLEGREQENFYDGEGLRAGISESGKAFTFIFHNGEILAECDENSSPVKRHLQGLGLSCVQTINDRAYHTYH